MKYLHSRPWRYWHKRVAVCVVPSDAQEKSNVRKERTVSDYERESESLENLVTSHCSGTGRSVARWPQAIFQRLELCF